MPLFEVQIVDRRTGKDHWVEVVASSREDAIEKAAASGEMVGDARLKSLVEPVKAAPTVAAPAPAPMPAPPPGVATCQVCRSTSLAEVNDTTGVRFLLGILCGLLAIGTPFTCVGIFAAPVFLLLCIILVTTCKKARKCNACGHVTPLGSGLFMPGVIIAVVVLVLTIAAAAIVLGGFVSVMGKAAERASQAQPATPSPASTPSPAVTPDAPKPATPAKPAARTVTPPKPRAAQVGQAFRSGDIEVTIVQVTKGRVLVKEIGSERGSSQSDLLTLDIEIRNTSTTRKVDYEPFSGGRFGSAHYTVVDDLGNRYKAITFGPTSEIVGQLTTTQSLYPEVMMTDRLVIEAPIGNAKTFTVTMQGGPVSAPGPFVFEFSTGSITRK